MASALVIVACGACLVEAQCTEILDALKARVWNELVLHSAVNYPNFHSMLWACWARSSGDWHPRRSLLLMSRPSREAGVPEG